MARNHSNTSEGVINRIVEGTEIHGEIKCSNNVRIDGVLNGNLTTAGKLVLGPTGRIVGDVVCENAEVEGNVAGRISIKQLLALKASAKVEGDIFTDKISIEPGAVFTGSCNMGKVMDMNKSKNYESAELQEEAV